MKKLIVLAGLGVWTALTVWISLTVIVFYLPNTLEQSRAVSLCFKAHGILGEKQSLWRHFIHRDGSGIDVMLWYDGDVKTVTEALLSCRFDSDMKLRWKF